MDLPIELYAYNLYTKTNESILYFSYSMTID